MSIWKVKNKMTKLIVNQNEYDIRVKTWNATGRPSSVRYYAIVLDPDYTQVYRTWLYANRQNAIAKAVSWCISDEDVDETIE
jgi:hypothetical protein